MAWIPSIHLILSLSLAAPSGESYRWVDFSPDDGLPNANIICLAGMPGSDLLFVGTGAGLASYDGLRWNRYSSPEALSGPIRELFKTDQGLWILSESSLLQFDGDQFRATVLTEDIALESVAAMHVTSTRATLLAANGGVYRLNGARWERIPDNTSKIMTGIRFLVEDSEQSVWALGEKDIWRWRRYEGSFEWMHTVPEGQSIADAVNWRGALTVLTDKGVLMASPAGWTELPPPEEGFPSNLISLHTSTAPSPGEIAEQGFLWVRTGRGLLGYFSPRTVPDWISKDRRLEAVSHDARFLVDVDGRVFKRTGDQSEPVSEERTSAPVRQVESHGRILWLGTHRGLRAGIPSGAEVMVPTRGQMVASSTPIIVTDRGDVWVSLRSGLARYRRGNWRTTSFPSVPGGVIVTCLLDGSGDDLWVGTTRGLYFRQRGEWFRLGTDEGLPSPSVKDLCRNDLGEIFVSGTGWVCQVDPAPLSLSLLHRGEGRSPWAPLAVGKEGWILFTEGNVVYRIRPGDQAQELFSVPESAPSSLVQDSAGTVWVGTDAGVFIWDGTELVKRSSFSCRRLVADSRGFVVGVGNTGLFRLREEGECLYTRAEGLPGGPYVDLAVSREGSEIWVSTIDGALFRLLPDSEPPETDRPVLVSSLTPDGDVRFELGGIDAWKSTPSDQLLFSWRLDDEPWSPFERVPRVTLTNLPRGEHTFHLRAMDRELNIDSSSASHRFAVPAPFYLQPPFMGAFLVVLSALLFLLSSNLKKRRDLVFHTETLHNTAYDLKSALAELKQANSRLKELDRLKSDFVSNVSHDLKTPLTSIRGFADNLLDGLEGPLTEKQTGSLERIRNRTQRLARMIDDLLDLARIESGRLELNIQPVLLVEAVREAEETVGNLVREKGLHLTTDLPERDLRVEADPDRLLQILVNLVQNAVKFTPSGGKVEIAAYRNPGNIQIEVRDTGPGIPPEDVPHVFEKFHQVQMDKKKTEGTGLGLSICRSLVELHGGTIGVQSEIGRGSVFHFTMPLSRG